MAIREGLPPAYNSCGQCQEALYMGTLDVTDIFQGIRCVKIYTWNTASYNYIIVAVVMHI